MVNSEEIEALVGEQLLLMKDDVLVRQLRECIVKPYATVRAWDYGQVGETRMCWMVMEHRSSNTGIAYCAEGFVDPWGLLSLSGPRMSLGMDASWFAHLEDAFRATAAWTGENPPGYEVR